MTSEIEKKKYLVEPKIYLSAKNYVRLTGRVEF